MVNKIDSRNLGTWNFIFNEKRGYAVGRIVSNNLDRGHGGQRTLRCEWQKDVNRQIFSALL